MRGADLDRIGVRRALCCVDELISEALSDGLDVTECTLASLSERFSSVVEQATLGVLGTYASGDEGDGLVDPSERRDIDSLTTDSTLRTNTRRVFTRASVDNGVNEDLVTHWHT